MRQLCVYTFSVKDSELPNGSQVLGYSTTALEGPSKKQTTATRYCEIGPQPLQSLAPRSPAIENFYTRSRHSYTNFSSYPLPL